MSDFFKVSAKSDIKKNPNIRIKESGLIHFSQFRIESQATGKLKQIDIQYNGLCEIISNYILFEDLLGENKSLPQGKRI